MIKKGDEIFELICITPDTNDEFSLGYFSNQHIANEQKTICEKQVREGNLFLEYEVRKHRIIK